MLVVYISRVEPVFFDLVGPHGRELVDDGGGQRVGGEVVTAVHGPGRRSGEVVGLGLEVLKWASESWTRNVRFYGVF